MPVKPEAPTRGLPPHPDEAPRASTFGDWYDAACGYLWRAEQVDLSLVRLVAGGLLIVLQFVGLLPLVQLAASVLPGVPVEAPDPRAALAGAALLAVVWVCWAVYRRRWNRAWELRKAWSWAIGDPQVLALPMRPIGSGEVRDVDTDPEMTHPYRARLHVRIADRPFVAEAMSRSHTDRVRRREVVRLYLPLMTVFMTSIAVAVGSIDGGGGPGQHGVLLVAWLLAALPPYGSCLARYIRRISFAQRLARKDVEERQRWMGWQLLHGVPGTEAPDAGAVGANKLGANAAGGSANPGERAQIRTARATERGSLNSVIFLTVFIGGIFGLVGILAALREPDNAPTILGFLALLVLCGLVPALLLTLRYRSARQTAGRTGAGFLVRVEHPDYPGGQAAEVPSGDVLLTFSPGRAHLLPLDESEPEADLAVTALISGIGQFYRGGKQWLVLSDDSHLTVTCSDYVGLRDAAVDAGIRVLLPGPQPSEALR